MSLPKYENTIEAAVGYRSLGWAPIPLEPRSKRPQRKGWPEERYTESEIRSRFDAQGNVGLLLGDPSGGLVDVDLDCPEAVAAAERFLPPTEAVFGRKGNPRSHRLYVAKGKGYEQFVDPLSEAPKEKTICEIRSTGQQTIVPPSTHPSGEAVGWETFDSPAEVDASELSRRVGVVASVALLARRWPAEGARHRFSLALGGFLLRRGIDLGLCEEVIEEAARIAGDEEWKDRVRTVGDTAQKLEVGVPASAVTGLPVMAEILGQRHAEEISACLENWLELGSEREDGKRDAAEAPFEPFPAHVLPEPLRAFVEEAAEAIGCDEAYVALPLLTALGAAIGNARVVEVKRDWTEPPILWTVIVGESGTLKSPALDVAVAPVRAREGEKIEEYKEALKDFERALEEYDRNRRKRSQEGKELSQKPEQPIADRSLVSDITVESIATLLQDAQRGLLLVRDELAAWLGSFDQYKKGRVDAPHWLEMHRGGTLLVDRKTGTHKIIFVSRASVSITGGIQPAALRRALGTEHLENGLAARLLVAMPPRRAKRWTEKEISPEAKRRMRKIFQRLWDLELEVGEEEKPVAARLRFSAEAKEGWVSFYDEHAREQARLSGPLASAWSKLEGYCARLALILHLVRRAAEEPEIVVGEEGEVSPTYQVSPTEISLESVRGAVTLTRWFGGEIRRVYAMLTSDEEEEERDRLIDLIERKGKRITVRDLSRSDRRFRGDRKGAGEALDRLVRAGLGRWEVAEPGPAGGRRTEVFVLTDERVDETGVDETGVDETGVDETGVDETRADGPGGNGGGVDETGVDETRRRPVKEGRERDNDPEEVSSTGGFVDNVDTDDPEEVSSTGGFVDNVDTDDDEEVEWSG